MEFFFFFFLLHPWLFPKGPYVRQFFCPGRESVAAPLSQQGALSFPICFVFFFFPISTLTNWQFPKRINSCLSSPPLYALAPLVFLVACFCLQRLSTFSPPPSCAGLFLFPLSPVHPLSLTFPSLKLINGPRPTPSKMPPFCAITSVISFQSPHSRPTPFPQSVSLAPPQSIAWAA